MDDRTARRLLGVAATAGPSEIRTAYRRLLRANHPDVAPRGDATHVTAEINLAYAALIGTSADPPAPTAPTAGAESRRVPDDDTPPVATVAEDADASLRLRAPDHDLPAVLSRLCAAADVIGDLSYVDRSNGILETVLPAGDGPTCSLMITLEARDGVVLAHCALESFDSRPGPPIRDVVRALSDALARMDTS